MRNRQAEKVVVECEVIGKTVRAIKVKHNGAFKWVPISQIYGVPQTGDRSICMTVWFSRKARMA
jgi:hypothetical protein